MHPSTVVEPGLGRSLGSSNLGMNHSPCRASSGRNTDSSKDSSTDSSRVSDMMCSLGNLGNIDTGKYRDSCSIGTGKDMSTNTAMDTNIHNPVRNSVHNLDRNPDQQPTKCKAPRGQEVPYLV
jgi:hypothetical protein